MQPWFTAAGNRILKEFGDGEAGAGRARSNFLNSPRRTLSKNAKCMSCMRRVVNERKFKFRKSRSKLFPTTKQRRRKQANTPDSRFHIALTTNVTQMFAFLRLSLLRYVFRCSVFRSCGLCPLLWCKQGRIKLSVSFVNHLCDAKTEVLHTFLARLIRSERPSFVKAGQIRRQPILFVGGGWTFCVIRSPCIFICFLYAAVLASLSCVWCYVFAKKTARCCARNFGYSRNFSGFWPYRKSINIATCFIKVNHIHQNSECSVKMWYEQF